MGSATGTQTLLEKLAYQKRKVKELGGNARHEIRTAINNAVNFIVGFQGADKIAAEPK